METTDQIETLLSQANDMEREVLINQIIRTSPSSIPLAYSWIASFSPINIRYLVRSGYDFSSIVSEFDTTQADELFISAARYMRKDIIAYLVSLGYVVSPNVLFRALIGICSTNRCSAPLEWLYHQISIATKQEIAQLVREKMEDDGEVRAGMEDLLTIFINGPYQEEKIYQIFV